MKSALRNFTALLKGLLRGKRKEAVAMETYLCCIPSIQKMVDKHLLGINLKNRIVIMDISLHLMYAPSRSGKEVHKADKRYAAFMDKIIAFMNFQLGRMGARDFIDPTKETVKFFVIQKQMQYFDNNGNPLPAHMQVSEKTILMGIYKNGDINYRECGENVEDQDG